METLFDLKAFFSPDRLTILLRTLILLFVGIPGVYFLSKWSRLYVSKHFTPQQGLIVGKLIQWTGMAFIIVMALREMGFELTPLLGAAGIVGIAVGFASQTSVSNIISGLFLITEQPFVVNDIIRIGDTIGQVLSIDMLSVKLRTFENQFVRIPNETILKSEVTTITRFPIRRADIKVSVAYKEDLDRVKQILMDIAHQHPLCLQEPAPLIFFDQFGSSSIDLRLAVWAAREDWLTVKNEIYETVKRRFDEEGIEIPFPHVSIYAGAVSDPIKIQMVDSREKEENS